MRYNANEHPEPQDNFSPLPKGRYQVRIAQAQECENSNRNGCYLKVELDVLGPTHQGRKLWAQMTTEHQESQQAVEIGLGQISAMARSIGRLSWDHEGEIIGLTGECYVGLEKNDPTRNRVTGWAIPTGETKGAPTYTRQHQQHGAEQHGVSAPGPRYGGAATAPANRAPSTNGPRQDVPHVADMPDFFGDSDVPF